MWPITNHEIECLIVTLLLLLLSRFSRVWLCVTPETAAHQAPPSLGFSRQEHWSGLPFPPPMHKSEKWRWSRSVVSDSSRSHGLQLTRLLHPLDSPGKSTGVGCHCLLRIQNQSVSRAVFLSRGIQWESIFLNFTTSVDLHFSLPYRSGLAVVCLANTRLLVFSQIKLYHLNISQLLGFVCVAPPNARTWKQQIGS